MGTSVSLVVGKVVIFHLFFKLFLSPDIMWRVVTGIYATYSFPGLTFDLPLWQQNTSFFFLNYLFQSNKHSFQRDFSEDLCSTSTRPAINLTEQ